MAFLNLLRLSALMGLCAWATIVRAADLEIGRFERAETPFGVMEIRKDGVSGDRLYWQGAALDVENWSLAINGAYIEAGRPEVWVLVTTHAGGNACDAAHLILRLDTSGIRRTEPLGGCKHGLRAARLLNGVFELEYKVYDLAVDKRIYAFDGTALRIIEGQVPAPVASAELGAGSDVTRWLGKNIWDIFEDRKEQARFARIMTFEQFNALRDHMSLGQKVVQRGDWVFGAGCRPHFCNTAGGFWGLQISTGAPVAVMFHGGRRGQPDQYFGAPQVFEDPVLRAFIAARRPN